MSLPSEVLMELVNKFTKLEIAILSLEQRLANTESRLGVVEDATINHESRLQELEEDKESRDEH